MGSCYSGRDFSTLDVSDAITETEQELGLGEFEFSKFLYILKEKAQDRQITFKEMEEAFGAYRFGKRIAMTPETVVKKLLLHPTFKALENTLDIYHLFAIGFLYCRGSVSQKVRELYDTYDFNLDGGLQRDKMEIIFRDIVEVAGTMLPAIKLNLSYAEASLFTHNQVQKLLDRSLDIMFENVQDIYEKNMVEILEDKVSYLNNATLIRRELRIKWDQFN